MPLGQIRRIPEVHPCDTPKMGNPQKWSIPRSLLQVPENGTAPKTGRGPRGRPRNGTAPFGGARGQPEATLCKIGNPENAQPRDLPSPLRATEGEAGQTDASASIAAILELHKEGKSNRAIAAALGLVSTTVDRALQDLLQNVAVTKCSTPEVSTSTVPMASTEDRSETREDARS